MGDHATYSAIVRAVDHGDLTEPFTAADFETACPGLGAGTYIAFLAKHAVGNPGGETRLFERVDRGAYRLVRPLKYGLQGFTVQ